VPRGVRGCKGEGSSAEGVETGRPAGLQCMRTTKLKSKYKINKTLKKKRQNKKNLKNEKKQEHFLLYDVRIRERKIRDSTLTSPTQNSSFSRYPMCEPPRPPLLVSCFYSPRLVSVCLRFAYSCEQLSPRNTASPCCESRRPETLSLC